MAADFDVIDRATGDVLVRVRHLWGDDPVACCMCERETFDHFAVPYYCGPVLDGQSEGGYRVACAGCYRRWSDWSDARTRVVTDDFGNTVRVPR